MRRLAFKDLVATVVVAAVAIPYIGYLVREDMAFIKDPRGMAGVGMAGLLLCFAAWGLGIDSTFGKVMLLVGAAALGLGVAAALIGAEGSEVLLAVFMAAIGIVWLVETGYHAFFEGRGRHAA